MSASGSGSKSRVVFDGLSRCLCPSVDPIAASRLLNSPAVSRTATAAHAISKRRPAGPSQSFPNAHGTQFRRYGNNAAGIPAVAAGTPTHQIPAAGSQGSDPNAQQQAIKDIVDATPAQLERHVLPTATTEHLLHALNHMQNRPHSFQAAAAIVKHLIQDRDVAPSARLYECLVACSRDTKSSADMLAQVLEEMKQLGLSAGTMIYHDALEVLAIHPNYLIRNEILWAMNQSWTEVDPRGQFSVALGLLRDGQYELALDKLEDILDNPHQHHASIQTHTHSAAHAIAPPWLFDVFVHVFTTQSFLDEAVRLAHEKSSATGADLPLPLWHALLDACARASHYEGTRYVWRRLGGTISGGDERRRVSDGALLAVVNAAARNGDAEMAAEAMHVLSAVRGARLGIHHYEALVDAYAACGDVASALRVLCIMRRALSVVPGPSCTRGVYACLKQRPALLDVMLKAMAETTAGRGRGESSAGAGTETRENGDFGARQNDSDGAAGPDIDIVPPEAVAVAIEAAAESHGFAKAFDIFSYAARYSRAPMDYASAFRHLLPRCEDPETLRALVAEDPGAALAADLAAFDRAVGEFAHAGDLEKAYECVRLLSKVGTGAGEETSSAAAAPRWLSKQTALTLVRCSLDARDERVWSLLEEAKRMGVDVQSGLSRLVASFDDALGDRDGLGRDGDVDGDGLGGRGQQAWTRTRRKITSGKRVVSGGGGADEESATWG